MGSTLFRDPQARSSTLAAFGTPQPRAFGSLNRVDPLDSVSNYYVDIIIIVILILSEVSYIYIHFGEIFMFIIALCQSARTKSTYHNLHGHCSVRCRLSTSINYRPKILRTFTSLYRYFTESSTDVRMSCSR